MRHWHETRPARNHGAKAALAVVALMAFGLVPPSAAAPAPVYSCDFEQGAAGWTASDSAIVLTTKICRSFSGRGGNALGLPVHFPGDATVSLKRSLRWGDAHALQASVFVPDEAVGVIQIVAYVTDGDLRWYQSTRLFQPVPGRWSTFRVDVSAHSVEWTPVGHFKPWDADVTRDIKEFGFRAFSKSKFEGKIYLDDITITREARHAAPLRILNFRTNTVSVPRCEKFEIAFALSRHYDNPFNPSEVDVTARFIAPNGEVTEVPGFFHQDFKRRLEKNCEVLVPLGASEWKVRFAPKQVGEYRYTLTVNDGERLVTEPRRFTCIPSENPGYVRVCSRDPRYFEFDSGKLFYPIGHNIPATFNVKAHDILGLTLLKQEGTFAYDRFLKGMGESGENFARIWLASWSFALEWSADYDIHYKGAGRYNLENAWKFDYVLDQAHRKGIHIQLALTTFGHYRSEEFEGDWPYSPYNVKRGGFLQAPWEFWASPRAWDCYKQMLRYVMARWGYSTAIAAWELSNEIDLVTNFGNCRGEILAWHESCAEWIKRFDQGHHLMTTNFANWKNDPEFLRLPVIAYTSTNRYDLNTVSALEQIYAAKSVFNKPALVAECGADFKGSNPATTERYIPICLWSSYMMPLGGTGMQWWWDFIDDRNLYFYFKALVEYARGEERRGQNLEMAQAQLLQTSGSDPVAGLAVRCLKNNHNAYLWVYETALQSNELEKDPPERAGVDVLVSGLDDGAYRVELWDTFKGGLIGEQRAATQKGSLRFSLPRFQNSIAVKVKAQAPKEK